MFRWWGTLTGEKLRVIGAMTIRFFSVSGPRVIGTNNGDRVLIMSPQLSLIIRCCLVVIKVSF